MFIYRTCSSTQITSQTGITNIMLQGSLWLCLSKKIQPTTIIHRTNLNQHNQIKPAVRSNFETTSISHSRRVTRETLVSTPSSSAPSVPSDWPAPSRLSAQPTDQPPRLPILASIPGPPLDDTNTDSQITCSLPLASKKKNHAMRLAPT